MIPAKTKPAKRGGKRPGAGRPKLGVTLQRQLAKLSIDPELVAPERILATIAADPTSPASARVAACKVLVDLKRQKPADAELPPSGGHQVVWHTRAAADA